MKKYIILILLGILFALPGEILNHLVFNQLTSGLLGLISTITIYFVFLFLAWISLSFLIKRTNKFKSSLVSYLLVGFFGLIFEWFVIGNSPWQNSEANQFAMFTFWGTLVLAPLILTNNTLDKKFRKRIWIYFFIVSASSLGLGFIQGGSVRFVGLFIWIYGTIALNIFYIKYFFDSKKESGKQF